LGITARTALVHLEGGVQLVLEYAAPEALEAVEQCEPGVVV